jgi:hypothetical protein
MQPCKALCPKALKNLCVNKLERLANRLVLLGDGPGLM